MLKGALEVDKKLRLEIKYAIISLSYFLIGVKNTMEISYKSLLCDVLVRIQCMSVSWTTITIYNNLYLFHYKVINLIIKPLL